MKRKDFWNGMRGKIRCFILIMVFLSSLLNARQGKGLPPIEEIEKNVREWVKNENIPGAILVIVGAYETEVIRGYGYSDLETRQEVTPGTLFELASCSKAFTALAVLQLESQGLLNLDAPVSHYFPWFSVTHRGQNYPITIRQLLHHTSGIPWKAFSLIPEGNQKDALEQVLRNLNGMEIPGIPGESYVYNSINYDILGAVIEKATGKSFETYMQDTFFPDLGLTHTLIGVEEAKTRPAMATGYKTGFFQPRKYEPPVFRGNNPAAYVISNGIDMARWLKIQLGLTETPQAPLVKKLHEPDLTVAPEIMTSYAMGWYVNPYRNSETFHGGWNPNFSSYIVLRPQENIGVAVLANCNNLSTTAIGSSVLKQLLGEKVPPLRSSADSLDSFCSIFSIVLGLYILIVGAMIVAKIICVFRGKCIFRPLSGRIALRILFVLLGSIPFLYGIYLVPEAIKQQSWKVTLVFGPISFQAAIILLLAAMGISYIQYIFALISPSKRKYRSELPIIGIVSMISGLAGTGVLFIVTTSFFSSVGMKYLLYYFGLVYLLNIGGRKIAQTKMINLSNNIALDLRVDLINKLTSATFQRFEKLKEGRIYTTLNDDTGMLAGSAGLAIAVVTNLVTLFSGFIYMMTISFISTLVVIAVIIALIFYYRLVAKKSRVFMEEARDAQTLYMTLMDSMIRGYKELTIHRRKKLEFKKDLINSSEVSCNKMILSSIKFLNADLTGDSIGLIVLGTLGIVISRVVSGVSILTLLSFVMVVLYLLGPMRVIIGVVPTLTRMKVSWNRIKEFVKDIDIDEKGRRDTVKDFIQKLDLKDKKEIINLEVLDHLHKNVEKLEIRDLTFEYEGENGQEGFSVGPIDLQVNKGEALFIIGGNGSGKTTIAKLITGLYYGDKGNIKINDQEVDLSLVGEYFSTIYSNYHLFKKIYGIDFDDKKSEIEKGLKLLKLEEKLQLKDGEFSTLDLSGGQRKRMALLQCWLEDRPIYLFDEVAADQDPEFRKFFYHELLVKMKERGKIIIAITHDDHYFDVADKIIKMDMGKIEHVYNSKGAADPVNFLGQKGAE